MTHGSRDSQGRALRLTSNLVTRLPPKPHFDQQVRRVGDGSSLVAPKQPVSQPDQRFAQLSSLVTGGALVAILGHSPGASRATPALDLRAVHRRSSLGSPACLASAVGSLSCSPLGKAVRNNISVGFVSVDGSETAADSSSIDVVFSSSRDQGSSWLASCLGSRARPIKPDLIGASSSPSPCPPCRHGIVNAIPARPTKCPRSRRNSVHVPLESASTLLWKPCPR